MRILHAFNQPRSGGGSLAGTLATIEVLRAKGHDVEVFTRNSRDFPAGMRGRLQAGVSAFHAPASVRAFEALLERFRPEVVHANELFPLISPSIVPLCAGRGIPVVMTCDDYHLTCPVRNHFREGKVCTQCVGGHEHRAVVNNCRDNVAESVVNALYTAMIRSRGLYTRNVSHFVTPSDFTGQWLVEHAGVDAARVSTIPHVIAIPATAADAGAGTYASFGGRFVPEKGIATLVEAAAICGVPLRLSRNEHHFVTIDLPPHVDVVVTRDRDDLAAFYRGSRMLVFPSIWFESFGIVGAEAMSHGIPVIGSRLGAVANLIEDGVDGFLFAPGDAQDLARKMELLWNDPAMSRRMGEAARMKALALWGRDRHAELVLEVYDKARGTRLAA